MFQKTTSSNEASSSEALVQVETFKPKLESLYEAVTDEMNVAGLARLFLNGKGFIELPDVWPGTDSNKPLVTKGMKTYLVDFRQIFQKLGRAAETDFYFYPGDIQGFVESCVLATQRELEVSIRDLLIFKELSHARYEWRCKEEANAWTRGDVTFCGDLTLEEYEVRNAMESAAVIDNLVLEKMSLIRQVHGDYAISSSSFTWTAGRALSMTLTA